MAKEAGKGKATRATGDRQEPTRAPGGIKISSRKTVPTVPPSPQEADNASTDDRPR